jgi:hypothetical protein
MMAKGKRAVVEIEFGSGYSEQSHGTEGRGAEEVRTAGSNEYLRQHEERLALCTDLAVHAQALSEEVILEHSSKRRFDESRRNLDWSIATARHDFFKIVTSPVVALAIIHDAAKYLAPVVEACGVTITAGKKSIHVGRVEEIDEGIAVIESITETLPEKPPTKKKAVTKKEAKGEKSKKPAKKKN